MLRTSLRRVPYHCIIPKVIGFLSSNAQDFIEERITGRNLTFQ